MNIQQESLKQCLTGTITARVYDEEGNLKRTHVARNVVTTLGINRLIDMLIDGYNQTYPKYYGDWVSNGWQRSTLHCEWDFDGGKDGEVFGVNIIDWPARSKSTFVRSTSAGNLGGVYNPDYMFNNNKYQYANFYNNWSNGGGYWAPQGENYGWICDFGITDISGESFTSPDTSNYYNLLNKNIKYGSLILQNSARTVTYTPTTDYLFTLGDGDTYGTIKLVNPALTNTTLKVSYAWFDVPQVPIVGFAIDCSAPGGAWNKLAHFHAFRWSLNQGQSRTYPFFPNRVGAPRHGWQQHYNNDSTNAWPFYHAFSMQGTENYYNPRTFFMNSLPWAVKNPTQLAWFGWAYNESKWIYEFQLLGYKMPKMGVHAIGLGTGNGVPDSSDTALFSPSITKVTQSKSRNGGTSGLEIKAYLDFSEGNGVTFTEAGLFYPSNDSVYFKEDTFWSGNAASGGANMHYNHISGSNKILKLSPLASSDFDKLASHAMYDTPWSKTSAERVELIYNLNVGW